MTTGRYKTCVFKLTDKHAKDFQNKHHNGLHAQISYKIENGLSMMLHGIADIFCIKLDSQIAKGTSFSLTDFCKISLL